MGGSPWRCMPTRGRRRCPAPPPVHFETTNPQDSDRNRLARPAHPTPVQAAVSVSHLPTSVMVRDSRFSQTISHGISKLHRPLTGRYKNPQTDVLALTQESRFSTHRKRNMKPSSITETRLTRQIPLNTVVARLCSGMKVLRQQSSPPELTTA